MGVKSFGAKKKTLSQYKYSAYLYIIICSLTFQNVFEYSPGPPLLAADIIVRKESVYDYAYRI